MHHHVYVALCCYAFIVAERVRQVPMVEAEAVREMRELAAKGWEAKRIARELRHSPRGRERDPQ